MCALAAQDLIQVWERGQGLPPARQALALLSAAGASSPERLTVGQRDAALLSLRRAIFGSRLACAAQCPACGEPLELSFEVNDLLLTDSKPPESLRVRLRGYEAEFRLPNSQDLADLAAETDPAQARLRLAERCLLAAKRKGEPVSAMALPETVVAAIAQKMAKADPQADLLISLTCPACSHNWAAPFDIVTFFWNELNTWAVRTLYEVHSLAAAYGWSEAEILAVSPFRRRIYMEMVGR